MKLTEIEEGSTKLLVPVNERLSKKSPVFFNPEMELSRDITVAIARILKPESFCDLLAGSGARGIRIAKEVGCKVTLNDLNQRAYRLILRNKELNDVNVNVTNLNANILLSRERFDFIDIDPFGSPVTFIDSALSAISRNGFLAITATDTGALCGTYPKACRRKYDAISLRTDYYNELGLRILIGCIARYAATHELGVIPLFSHCTRHYFRTYLKISAGRRKADDSLKNVRFIQHCFNCMNRELRNLNELKERCRCNSEFNTLGPLWTGKIADPGFCNSLIEELKNGNFGSKREALRLVQLISEETEIDTPYYNIHKAFKKLKAPAQSMEIVIKELKNKGFKAKRTHFSGLGLRTDADAFTLFDTLHKVKK